MEKARRTTDYRKEKPLKAVMEFKFGELEVQFRGKHIFIYNGVLDLFHKTKGDKEMGR